MKETNQDHLKHEHYFNENAVSRGENCIRYTDMKETNQDHLEHEHYYNKNAVSRGVELFWKHFQQIWNSILSANCLNYD